MGLAKVPSPAWYTTQDAAAIKAVASGTASPEQQKTALEWVVLRASMYGEETFSPGHTDSSAYFAGRRSVALQVMFLRDTPLAELIQKETK